MSAGLREDPDAHPFVAAPHRTLVALAFPVLVSLLAEPITGLVDTFFLARLGAPLLAGLGVATALLSGVFWVFNFLGIGTQTEVARASGAGSLDQGRRAATLAVALAALLGVLLAASSLAVLEPVARWMGARGDSFDAAVLYLEVRLIGAPAVLVMLAGFGALRGLQDMQTPLRIALVTNLINVVLDPILIFGLGPLPALGIGGAAAASVATQWIGAAWAVLAVRARLGLDWRLEPRRVLALLVVGRDLVIRTALLLAFQVLATRFANLAGVESGAAHQAVRQFWLLSALALDAWAAAAQSLVGFFRGAARIPLARRVAAVACQWSLASGFALAFVMLGCAGLVAQGFVPPEARAVFPAAWTAGALAQPVNALAFATDGIHWGTGDYRYLRNGMLAATGLGAAALWAVDLHAADALAQVWYVTALWISMRAAFGVVRIWPAPGRSPLARTD